MIKSHGVAPVYVINILMCDLIQISSHRLQLERQWIRNETSLCRPYRGNYAYDVFTFAALVNVCFMMCVSVERYIMIAHAIWYRTVREVRTKICVSVAIYRFSTILAIIHYFFAAHVGVFYFLSCFLIVPYILIMFVSVGTWRALSRSFLPRNDPRRILAVLAVILVTYTICFLPLNLNFLLLVSSNFNFDNMGLIRVTTSVRILTTLNPLFDLILYVLIRPDGTDLCNTVFCWLCKRQRGNTAEPNGATTEKPNEATTEV